MVLALLVVLVLVLAIGGWPHARRWTYRGGRRHKVERGLPRRGLPLQRRRRGCRAVAGAGGCGFLAGPARLWRVGTRVGGGALAGLEARKRGDLAAELVAVLGSQALLESFDRRAMPAALSFALAGERGGSLNRWGCKCKA